MPAPEHHVCARAAAADAGAADETKLAVVAARDTICSFKATGGDLGREHIEPAPLAG